MSLDISQIINITTRISAAGLSTANFGSAVIMADYSEHFGNVSPKEIATYISLADLAVDYPSTSEVYAAAAAWFATIPNSGQIQVYQMPNQDPDGTGSNTISIVDVLNEARESYWWYITIFNKSVYQAATAGNTSELKEIAEWGEANQSMIPNCVSGAALTDVLDASEDQDICSVLTTAGIRHCFSLCSADPYAGVSLMAHFASVDYRVTNSAITGEYKKLSTVPDDFTTTQIKTIEDKNGVIYSSVDSAGSVDLGRVINSITHSSYVEWIDNIFDLDAFVNSLQVKLYNVLTGQITKLPQTPAGQRMLIAAAQQVCQDYINNGYLGEREITDSQTGQKIDVPGYQILSVPEDILKIDETQRQKRQAAPLNIAVYPANAIHTVNVTLDVY